jgi:RecG-like helicase
MLRGRLFWFFLVKIHPFIFSKLRVGQKYIVTGKVEIFDHSLQISHPEFIFKQNLTTPVMPVYPLTYGIVNKQLYSYIREAINILENAINTKKSFSEQKLEERKYIDELLSEIKNLHLIGYLGANYDIERNGIDIKEKKMTLPLIYALSNADRSTRRFILNIVKNESDKTDKVREVIDIVRQSGGIEYAQEAMYRYRQEAFDLLMQAPDTPARQSLYDLLIFVTERKK